MCPVLIHHAANRGRRFPPSSLAGLSACLAAHAQIVEVDIQALADGDYALLHDATLESSTTGHGPVGARTAEEVRGLRLVWHGRPVDQPVATLSQVVALLQGEPWPVELQLDLKFFPTALLTEDRLRSLVRLVEPLGSRVRISSPADWSLRRLHALAPGLNLGYDPLAYLDLRQPKEEEDEPPYRTGAYGYRDDHPLAAVRWGPPADYLAERAEALWLQVPFAGVWYIRGSVLARGLDEGFDWIAFLHGRGALVDAWTLDVDRPGCLEVARRLVAAGVDRITTNDPPALAEALGGEVCY